MLRDRPDARGGPARDEAVAEGLPGTLGLRVGVAVLVVAVLLPAATRTARRWAMPRVRPFDY